jgi:hypothetical protein
VKLRKIFGGRGISCKSLRTSELFAGLPPWRLRFKPGSVHVGFVVDKVALEQVFL